MLRHSSFSIAILAGGRSTRMAADKALLPVGGIPMLERIAATALQISPHLLIIGREKPAAWPAHLPAAFLPDHPLPPPISNRQSAIGSSSAGPLLGLLTALAHTHAPTLCLPCDTPLLSPTLLQKLLAAHSPQNLATIATTPTGPEPLLAVYTPALLPTLNEMHKENRRALHPLIQLPHIQTFPIPEEHLPELLNLNTPADLAQAESLLQQRSHQQQ